MKARFKYFVPLLAALALAGCAFLQTLEKPKTLADDIYYAKGTLAGILNSSAAALDKSQIRVADAEHVHAFALQARKVLDLSKQIYDGCVVKVPTTTLVKNVSVPVPTDVIQAALAACGTGDALANYRLASNILAQLTLYLQTKGVK